MYNIFIRIYTNLFRKNTQEYVVCEKRPCCQGINLLIDTEKGVTCPTHMNSRDILFDPVFQMIETIERVWFVMNVGFRL